MRNLLLILLLLATPAALAAPPTMPRAAITYRADLLRAAHLVWGLDAPVAVMAAQVHHESGWRPDARSPYAHGLAQFTPATADWIGRVDPALAPADTGNPVWALRALARYDRWLHERIRAGTPCDRWWATLRAYNGGLGHWIREARLAAAEPANARAAVDAQCGRATRHASHCRENLAYPLQILTKWQPLYASWGSGVTCS